MQQHLWDSQHSYYCSEGNYFKNGLHHEYKTWSDFLSEWGAADEDYNMIFRWDWDETAYDEKSNEVSSYNGDDNYRNGTLKLYYMMQRKACNQSVHVSVCRADEPAVREFLTKKWAYIQSLWDPLSDLTAAPQTAADSPETPPTTP